MSVVQETPELISLTTIFSLGATAAILFTAYLTSLTLPKPTPIKTRILFIWHAFDALIHFTLEGSFLYTVFTTSIPLPAPTSSTSTSGASHLFSSLTGLSTVSDPSTNLLPGFPHAANFPITPPAAPFLGDASRLYGAFYGSSPAALLWQEYARADARWGGSDLTVISLELLTVFVMAPLAVWICYALRKGDGRAWFAMVVVATGELYGGFMTFCPEWLTGSSALDTSNAMFLWVYLVFFNMLWVFIPAWVLYEAYGVFGTAMKIASTGATTRAQAKKLH